MGPLCHNTCSGSPSLRHWRDIEPGKKSGHHTIQCASHANGRIILSTASPVEGPTMRRVSPRTGHPRVKEALNTGTAIFAWVETGTSNRLLSRLQHHQFLPPSKTQTGIAGRPSTRKHHNRLTPRIPRVALAQSRTLRQGEQQPTNSRLKLHRRYLKRNQDRHHLHF